MTPVNGARDSLQQNPYQLALSSLSGPFEFGSIGPPSNSPRDDTIRPPIAPLHRAEHFNPRADAIVFQGPCQDFLSSIPSESVQLIVTSPPYNLGKEYEERLPLAEYVRAQREVISDCFRVLMKGGSLCWQVGNHIDRGEVFPLDIILYPIFKSFHLHLRNRIIWHFGHGLHASRRFSGRHEAILWFTKGDDYFFNVDPIRLPQKYPNKKAFKGPNRGKLTGNPLGKNPGDVWNIPNVKSNHVEKTIHPCQFPVELVERLVLSMSRPHDLVLDPFGGVGTTVIAAILHGRRGAMAEVVAEYITIAHDRLTLAERGLLRTRPITRPVYEPAG